MSPIAHLFMACAVAKLCTFTSLTKGERAIVTLASVVPDVDGVGIIAERLTPNWPHPLNWRSDDAEAFAAHRKMGGQRRNVFSFKVEGHRALALDLDTGRSQMFGPAGAVQTIRE